MKRSPILRAGLAVWAGLCAGGCASISTEQAAIERMFPVAEAVTLQAIEQVAVAAGYKKVSAYEFQRVIRTKHDPLLGLVEVSKQMDVGLGFTLTVASKGAASLVTVHPVQIVRMPLTESDYVRSLIKPGSQLHAEVTGLIESAKARAEFL